MTRFDQIAAAFPLHAQRIAELAYQQDPDVFREFMTEQTWRHHKAVPLMLMSLFYWSGTSEGFDYWNALCNGQGFVSEAPPWARLP